MAGFHEVIYTESTKERVEKRLEDKPDEPIWRVSSTLFSHITVSYTHLTLPTIYSV